MDDVSKQLTITDPDLGVALQKAIKSQRKNWSNPKAITAGHYEADEKDQDFADAAKEALSSSTSQQDRGKYLLNVLKDKSDMSVDKLAVLADLSMLAAQESKQTKGEPNPVKTEKQNALIIGAKTLLTGGVPLWSTYNLISTYIKSIKEGKNPQEAVADAKSSETTRLNSKKTQYKLGDIVPNSKGELAEVIGFSENGAPIVKRKISGKSADKPTTK